MLKSNKKVSYVNREAQIRELAKLGIHTQEQFKAALAKMEPLDIGCFTSQAVDLGEDSQKTIH